MISTSWKGQLAINICNITIGSIAKKVTWSDILNFSAQLHEEHVTFLVFELFCVCV